MNIFASGLGKPRVIERGPDGDLWVSIPASGKIIALPDGNNDGVSERPRTIATGLKSPHGFAFRCNGDDCDIFVGETNAVSQYSYNIKSGIAKDRRVLVPLPSGGRHTTRTLLFLPGSNEQKLLVSIGSSCDTCREEDSLRASIQLLDITARTLTPYATGLRNSVFMAEHPTTHDVFATDMGRDYLGDDLPPDEINIIKQGKNYGWPNCYGKNVHDTVFDKNTYIRNPCMEPFEIPSLIDLPAHSAALGIGFVPSTPRWSSDWQLNIIVAYHGSWNRSVPTGYKVVRFTDPNKQAQDLVTGFVQKGKTIGRPAGILVEGNGQIFIADDSAGNIYRLVAPLP